MTEKKQKHLKKGWIIAAAAVLVLLCALFTANAAADGAIFNGKLFQDLHIFLNGEEFTYELTGAERTTDQDGNPVDHYSIALPDGKSIDAYAAEEYTAFAVDADDADSIQIVGTDEDGSAAYAESHPSRTTG
ncbi:MAG: hypothetical protein IJT44_06790 [Clostridia bacterium]|nr:hypothetical protein [Clostridia bacterium]